MSISSHREPPPAQGVVRRVPLSVVLLGLLFAGVVVVQVAATGDAELETPMFGLCFLVLNVLGVALSARAALMRRLEPAVRRPWRYMVVALLLYTVSTVGFAIGAVAGIAAAEWAAIAARLAMVPMLLIAVLTFPMRHLSRSERYKLALDVTTVAGGGFIVMWYFIIGPALTSGHSATVAVSLAGFPLGDLVLIFGVCAVLMRGGATTLRHPLTILLAGLVLFLAADVYYSYAEVQHRGEALSLQARLGLLGGTFLMVVAAAQQIRAHTGSCPPRPTGASVFGRSQLPYAGLALGYLLLLFATAREGALFPWGGLVFGVIMMTGAVALRQLIAMRENHKLVVTDSLTGLTNRVRLRSRLDQLIGRRQPFAVLLIDLDGFKQVNDTLGHEAGDTLLVTFARVLTDSVRQGDTASRLGGDEFAVVLPGITDVAEAGAVAVRILAAARTPVRLAGTMVEIRCSVGIALAGAADDIEGLMHRADVAMYAAKRTGSHGWLAYTDEMRKDASEDAVLSRDLGEALASGELHLSYEPVVTLSDGQVAAVQAVLTWSHPTRELLTSDVFINEDADAVDDVGMWVLDQTCRQAVRLRLESPAGRTPSACVSLPPHLLHRPDLVTEILGAVARTGLEPGDLVLEVPGEPAAGELVVGRLHALREHGVRIAVDDFGTGYASLRGPAPVPVDILKMGRVFVAELDADGDAAAVADAVVRLSRLLHPAGTADGGGDVPEPGGLSAGLLRASATTAV